jgi:hypothetical protein
MKYVVQVGSDVMILIPNFIYIGSGIKKQWKASLRGWDFTGRFIFSNKYSGSEMHNKYKKINIFLRFIRYKFTKISGTRRFSSTHF